MTHDHQHHSAPQRPERFARNSDDGRRRGRWLCIAYAFPPINRSGTHRTLGFVKQLDRLGWDAAVITANPNDDPLDDALLNEIPHTTRVVRTPWTDPIAQLKDWLNLPESKTTSTTQSTHPSDPSYLRRSVASSLRRFSSLRDWISRLLITPDSRTGWIAPAVRAGLDEVARCQPDVIYSTSPCHSAHLIAWLISKQTRIPWVADFRDPWVDNPFRDMPFASLARWDACLERRVLRRADHIVCTTPTMTRRFIERVPELAGKCSTILNGFDAERFSSLTPKRVAPPTDFVLTHAGQFYGPRSPMIWFNALRKALVQAPELRGRLRLLLIGPETYKDRHLIHWAKDAAVNDAVHVIGRQCHAETLSLLAGSDALALAASQGPGADLQVPNKLFEYLALRNPIIATCSQECPVRDILGRARADALTPHSENDLAEAIVAMAVGDRPKVSSAWQNVQEFDRTHRAAELADIIGRVSGVRSGLGAECVRRVTFMVRPKSDIPLTSMAPGFDDALSTTRSRRCEESSSRPAPRPSTSRQSCPDPTGAVDAVRPLP